MSATHDPTYVVTSPPDLARALMRAAAFVLVVGVASRLVGHHWWPALVLLVVGALWWVPSARAAWTRLEVGASGIRVSAPISWRRSLNDRAMAAFETRTVAWAEVHRLEVDLTREQVCVVLRADAPLPTWLTGRVVDTSDPESGPRLERSVPAIDPVAVHTAVRAFSPHTPVHSR